MVSLNMPVLSRMIPDPVNITSLWQDSRTDTPDNLGESWGLCSDMPRLPGRDFDYTEDELTSTASAGLDQLPGCSFLGMHMVGNRAQR